MKISVIFFVLVAKIAWASEPRNQTKIITSPPASERLSTVTNPELRAYAGSMSKISVKTSLSYSGSQIGSPFQDSYRKVDSKSASENLTSLSGSISGRYRIDRKRTLDFGSGLKAVTPFHGTDRVDVKDPYLSYSKVDRNGALQYRGSFGVSATTDNFYSGLGQVGSGSFSYGMKYYLGESRFRLSLNGLVRAFFYDEDVSTRLDLSDYYMGFFPGLDYGLSDRLSIKTSLSLSVKKLKRKPLSTWKSDILSQRLGSGISISPVIYLYPYVNFFPDRFTWATSTLSVSTTFSVF